MMLVTEQFTGLCRFMQAEAPLGKATESLGWTVLQVLAAADLELAAMAVQAVLAAAERCLFAFTKIEDLWFTRKCLPTLYGA